jgi:hypothetical protein
VLSGKFPRAGNIDSYQRTFFTTLYPFELNKRAAETAVTKEFTIFNRTV